MRRRCTRRRSLPEKGGRKRLRHAERRLEDKAIGLVSGVFLFDNPIWHLIDRLCVYLAPGSNKDWNCDDEKHILKWQVQLKI